MKIAVMGTGGVGGYFGGKLAASGLDVGFIARGAHLAVIREKGLRIESQATGDVHVQPARASDDPGEIGPVDIVLFATKLWDVEASGAACKPLIGPGTAVISLLNGVDSQDRLIPILGAEHVVGASPISPPASSSPAWYATSPFPRRSPTASSTATTVAGWRPSTKRSGRPGSMVGFRATSST